MTLVVVASRWKDGPARQENSHVSIMLYATVAVFAHFRTLAFRCFHLSRRILSRRAASRINALSDSPVSQAAIASAFSASLIFTGTILDGPSSFSGFTIAIPVIPNCVLSALGVKYAQLRAAVKAHPVHAA